MRKTSIEILNPEHLALLTKAFPPTEEQEQVIKAPLEPLLVVAGAGSGKTETIANRLVYWVVNGAISPQSVLGLTFTKKATAEMGQRFALRLDNLAQNLEKFVASPSSFEVEMCRQLKGDWQWRDDSKIHGFIRSLTAGLHTLQESGMTSRILRSGVEVSTYDALASKVLTEFGVLAGRDSGYQTITDGTRFQIMSQILETWVSSLSYREEEGASVGNFIEGLLHLAGDVNAHVVDLNTMKKLYADFLATAQRELLASQKLDEALEPLKAAKKAAKAANDKQREKALGAEITNLDLPLTSQAKKDLERTVEVMRFGVDAVEVIRAFNTRKAQLRFADFSDQTREVVELLKKVANISQSYQQRYQLVLLDEFQDTSVAQLKYLSALFRNHAVTAVGDPNQAIYAWRGASAASIEEFPKYFSDNPSKVASLTLRTSWRNDAAILNVANCIASEIAEQNRTEGKNENFIMPDLSLRPGASPDLGRVYGAPFLTDTDEAQAVANFLENWRKDLEQAVEKTAAWQAAGRVGQPPSLPTAAVLCRKKSIMLPILRELSRRGIPFQLQARESALLDPGVVLVRAALNVVVNPQNSGSLLLLLNRFRLSREDLEAISKAAGRTGLPFQEVMKSQIGASVSQPGRERLAILREIIAKLEKHVSYATPLQMAKLAAKLLGLDIEQRIPGTPYQEEAFTIFLSIIEDFERSGQATLRAFLEWLDVAESEEKEVGQFQEAVDTKKVQVITVHAAKGLEWDYVAVPGLSEGNFPDNRTEIWLKNYFVLPYPLRGDRDSLPQYEINLRQLGEKDRSRKFLEQYDGVRTLHHLKEEANLAYVAFTRAKSHLFLSMSWFKGCNVNTAKPGAFFRVLLGEDAKLFCMEKPNKGMTLVNSQEFMHLPDWLGDINPCFTEPEEANPNVQEFEAGLWQAPSWLDLPPESIRPETFPWDVAGLQRSYQMVTVAAENPPDSQALESAIPGSLSWRVWKLYNAPRPRLDSSMLLRQIAATSVVKLDESSDDFMLQKLRPLPLPPSPAARLGIIMHAWIAQQLGQPTLDIPDGSEATLDADSRLKLDCYRQTWENLQFLKGKAVMDIEHSGSLVVGEGTEGFEVPLRIDAVFQERSCGTTWIVDWKTASHPNPPQYERYLHQLGIYRLYWLQTHPELDSQDIQCAYVYLKEGETGHQVLTLESILEHLKMPDYTPEYLYKLLKRGETEATEFLSQKNL